MIEFFIVTDCSERGLYRKAKRVKRICRNNHEAKSFRFSSPEDIPAAQDFCTQNGISVTGREWEDLLTAGRLSIFAEEGTLPPAPAKNEALQECQGRKKDILPRDAAAVIFTDGSFFPDAEKHKKNGRKHSLGGWAAVMVLRGYRDAMVMVSGHTAKNTKTGPYYMELLAVAKALKRLKKYAVDGPVVLYTDCQSVAIDYNQKLAGWEECGFKKPDGTHIKNYRLWQKIRDRARNIRLQVCWMKGHAKNPYNDLCHLTAQAEAVMRLDPKPTAAAPIA